MDIDYFINNYPKTRPFLDPEIEKIYNSIYLNNRQGSTGATSIAQKLEKWMHLKANNFIKEDKDVLEIGAGTLNHLNFNKSYKTYDVIEPFRELYINSKNKNKVNNFYSDIGDLDKKKYDYVISFATLEHLENLPYMVSSLAKVLNERGEFISSIPSEGGFLWGLAWRIGTGLEFKLRYNLDYSNLMRHEHINSCFEILKFLKIVFEKVKVYKFGLGNHFSLYQCIKCSDPRQQIVDKFI